MKRALCSFSLLLVICASLTAREWTATDGRKLQADFVSSANGQVTLKRATDGQTFTLPLSRLSATDNTWIAEQGKGGVSPGKPLTGPFADLVKGDWALSNYKGLPFAFWASSDLDASKKHPLVLCLHGKSPNDENGKQVGGWMKSFAKPENQKERPCIIVSPLCYQPFGATGAGWYDRPGQQTLALVKELIKELPVDKDRIYIAGHSMGGFGTCHLINSEPKLFAAGVPMAGCTGPDTAASFKKTPIWIHHAADDNAVEVKCSRDLAEALKRVKECQYTEYPDGGHGIPGKVFDDVKVHEWLFSHGVK